MSENSEHTVVIPAREMDALRRWMERPNGSSGFLGEAGRVTFEAVAGGGVMVRTRSARKISIARSTPASPAAAMP